jgi:hypothetical protein
MVILFDQFNLPSDVFEIIFATEQQKIVGKLLINLMKEKGGEIGKSEMSAFATALHDGTKLDIEENGEKHKVDISYNKRQFYDRILTPMKSMGIIDYNLYKKTYKLSEKFSELMVNIGKMWEHELAKKL